MAIMDHSFNMINERLVRSIQYRQLNKLSLLFLKECRYSFPFGLSIRQEKPVKLHSVSVMTAVRLLFSRCIMPSQFARDEDRVMETMKQMIEHEQQSTHHHHRLSIYDTFKMCGKPVQWKNICSFPNSDSIVVNWSVFAYFIITFWI